MSIQLVVPVAGLPAGPATEATVRRQLKLAVDDTIDDSAIEQAINAANVWVCGRPVVVDELLPTLDFTAIPAAWTWPADLAQGATMLAARLYRRRNSIEGVAAFSEGGATYVQRNDPDVAMLLRLGSWARPGVA